jgi:hypothetical protein
MYVKFGQLYFAQFSNLNFKKGFRLDSRAKRKFNSITRVAIVTERIKGSVQ